MKLYQQPYFSVFCVLLSNLATGKLIVILSAFLKFGFEVGLAVFLVCIEDLIDFLLGFGFSYFKILATSTCTPSLFSSATFDFTCFEDFDSTTVLTTSKLLSLTCLLFCFSSNLALLDVLNSLVVFDFRPVFGADFFFSDKCFFKDFNDSSLSFALYSDVFLILEGLDLSVFGKTVFSNLSKLTTFFLIGLAAFGLVFLFLSLLCFEDISFPIHFSGFEIAFFSSAF